MTETFQDALADLAARWAPEAEKEREARRDRLATFGSIAGRVRDPRQTEMSLRS